MAAMSRTLPPKTPDSDAGPQSLRRRSLYETLRNASQGSSWLTPPSLSRFPVEMEEQERFGGVGGRDFRRGRVVAKDWLRFTTPTSKEDDVWLSPPTVAYFMVKSGKGGSFRLGKGGVPSSSSSTVLSWGRQSNGTCRA